MHHLPAAINKWYFQLSVSRALLENKNFRVPSCGFYCPLRTAANVSPTPFLLSLACVHSTAWDICLLRARFGLQGHEGDNMDVLGKLSLKWDKNIDYHKAFPLRGKSCITLLYEGQLISPKVKEEKSHTGVLSMATSSTLADIIKI